MAYFILTRANTTGTMVHRSEGSARLYILGFRERGAETPGDRVTDDIRLCEYECFCEECGERFWAGSPNAATCCSSCRSRRWRAKQARIAGNDLAGLCTEVVARHAEGSAAYSKMLPRLLRQTAVELRRRGWDPLELILSVPDQPATADDDAPGGFEGAWPNRRKWLHPPDKELEIINKRIAEMAALGRRAPWHTKRRAILVRRLQGEEG